MLRLLILFRDRPCFHVVALIATGVALGALGARPLVAESPYRARKMLAADLAFKPSVFWEDQFPRCDFLEPGRARVLLGDYKIDTTYYADDYRVVEQPGEPGRYGAVVTIQAEDGATFTRYRTLYRTPQKSSLFLGSLTGNLTLPTTTGVAAATWHQQSEMVNDYLALAISRDVQTSHHFAVLLAGMNDLGPSAATASKLEDAIAQDRQWWLGLKRNLNGNAKKYDAPFVAPQVVSGLKSRELRSGTEEQAGMRPGAVAEIDAVLTEWANDSDQPFNACVARGGVLFFDKAYGSREGQPVTTDTRHIVYSITKALSGSLLMMFVDQGIVRLDDPIEKFLPEFQRDGVETPATFHHLFTHTADMDGHFTDFQNDLEHVYGEAYPHLQIGQQHRYNGTSIGIGLKALEQITGDTLPTLYKKHLFDPLGCETIESIDGSALTWSHSRDLARVGQMLANRGSYGNKRFVREETFAAMLPRKLEEVLGPDTNTTWGIGLTWFEEGGLSAQTIGHGSASSCTLRVDLEHDLVITMTRETAGENFDKYHPKFLETVTRNIAE